MNLYFLKSVLEYGGEDREGAPLEIVTTIIS